jgi:hypothetical protein
MEPRESVVMGRLPQSQRLRQPLQERLSKLMNRSSTSAGQYVGPIGILIL